MAAEGLGGEARLVGTGRGSDALEYAAFAQVAYGRETLTLRRDELPLGVLGLGFIRRLPTAVESKVVPFPRRLEEPGRYWNFEKRIGRSVMSYHAGDIPLLPFLASLDVYACERHGMEQSIEPVETGPVDIGHTVRRPFDDQSTAIIVFAFLDRFEELERDLPAVV